MATENATPIPTAAEPPLYTYSLRNERQHSDDILHMIQTGEPPSEEHVAQEILAARPRGASPPELAVEIAARNLIEAISTYPRQVR